jgi:hypothetical protein
VLCGLTSSLYAQSDAQLDKELQEAARQIKEEAKPSIVQLDVGDTGVDLEFSGYWKSQLSGGLGFTHTPLGFSMASNNNPVFFQQDADLIMSLWVNKKWFVETSYHDNELLSTYRAGYQGGPGNFVQYAGVGNTGLDFPEFPYIDTGGSTNEDELSSSTDSSTKNNPLAAVGFYGKFGSGATKLHTLVRYDNAETEERTFVGSRERTYSYSAAPTTLRGQFFILPQDNISGGITVYFEDKDGTILDSAGGKWRRALSSEYAASSAQGIVELLVAAPRRVAVSYAGGYSLGTYGTAASPGNGFLGDIQKLFTGYDLNTYPQPGDYSGAQVPGTVSIGGANSLVIWEAGTFSPFESRARYTAPSGAPSDADVVNTSADTVISKYQLSAVSSLNSTLSTASTADAATSASTDAINLGTGIYSNVWQINNTNDNKIRDPLSRFPFADTAAGQAAYLDAKDFDGSFRVRWTYYGGSGGYFLGENIPKGSIHVYRDGIEDTGWSYNSQTGYLTLLNQATSQETIRVTFQSGSTSAKTGSLTAAVGITTGTASGKDKTPFYGGAAFVSRWNLG